MIAQSSKTVKPRYVLIIEDNVHHAEILTEILDHHFSPVVIHTVDTVKDGLELVSQSQYDLILTGAVIHDTPVTNAMTRMAQIANEVPIIVISGRGDERLAAELIKMGATEYLVKTHETLEALPSILEKHFKKGHRHHRKLRDKIHTPHRLPSPTAIIREVDKLTQQALAMVEPRRRKRGAMPANMEQLDQLLSQIRRLREMASKLDAK